MKGSCPPSSPKRDDWLSFSQPARQTSQRSGILSDEPDHVLGLGLLQPVRAAKLVHREATGNGAAVAHRFLGVDQELLEESHAVLERAAVFIGAVIELPGEEVMQEAQPVAGIHIDQVVTRTPGAKRRRLVPAADVADVLLVHGARLDGFVSEARNRAPGRRHRHFARIEVGTVQAVITRLNSRIVDAMVELSPIRAGGREDGSRAVSGVALAC